MKIKLEDLDAVSGGNMAQVHNYIEAHVSDAGKRIICNKFADALYEHRIAPLDKTKADEYYQVCAGFLRWCQENGESYYQNRHMVEHLVNHTGFQK